MKNKPILQRYKQSFLYLLILWIGQNGYCVGGNITITGTVKDVQGTTLSGASIVFTNGSDVYKATSNTDGTYQILIPYTGIQEISYLDVFTAIPNPFTDRTRIPLYAYKQGPLLFSIYNLTGQKVWEASYQISNGASYLEWNGINQYGAPVPTGLYVYSIVFNGKKYSGKMVKAHYNTFSGGPMSLPAFSPVTEKLKSVSANNTLQFTAKVSLDGYNKINATIAMLRNDTVINFTLYPYMDLPFKTSGNYLAYWDYKTLQYEQIFLKGINLGSSPPGYQPGEIGYAIEADQYERWINRMGEMGFNSLRIFTLHPPIFYEKLAKYNEAHVDKPLYLFQGIWLNGDTANSSHDLWRFSDGFDKNIEEVVNCVHGSQTIPERSGRAYGNYSTDVSQWVVGYIIGREIAAEEIRNTNILHSSSDNFSGNKLGLSSATPAETWLAARLDKVLSYEKDTYRQERPVSVSSWPTLDPLKHPTEPDWTDEDVESVDLANLDLQNAPGGYFASFHAYPYYPDFINDDPEYQKTTDSYGPNSYLGYLKDLKRHYSNIPLIIAEFGVPSSWGSAHQSFSGMHQGGHTEEKQGEYDIRMLKNMYDSNYGGGMMFAWMDEWWKPTWIVDLLESEGFYENGKTDITPTRQLWLNVCSAEQNFGLISFDPADSLKYIAYDLDASDKFLSKVQATHDDRFFHLELTLPNDLLSTDTLWVAFDTYRFSLGESILPNKATISNRAEFVLEIPVSKDTANFYVTQAYDEFGLTSRYNDADTMKQLFKTVPTEGNPWDLMRWKNNSNPDAIQDIGKILMKNPGSATETTNLHGVFVEPRKILIRIPWTMLYFSDPTRLEIVDGFISNKQGLEHVPIRAISDGIAISVARGKEVVNSTSRYVWQWPKDTLPRYLEREKACVPVIEKGLSEISTIPKIP